MPESAPAFLTLEITEQFEKASNGLQKAARKQLVKRLGLLFQNPAHPSLNAHQIKPDKYYWEAYLNRSDRIIYIPAGSHLILVDVVTHDDIARYSKRPRQG